MPLLLPTLSTIRFHRYSWRRYHVVCLGSLQPVVVVQKFIQNGKMGLFCDVSLDIPCINRGNCANSNKLSMYSEMSQVARETILPIHRSDYQTSLFHFINGY